MSVATYIVTYLPAERSEPREEHVARPFGDEAMHIDGIIDVYWEAGDEVIHIRRPDGTTVWHARGIDS